MLHAGTMQQTFLSDTQPEPLKENIENIKNENSNPPKSENKVNEFGVWIGSIFGGSENSGQSILNAA